MTRKYSVRKHPHLLHHNWRVDISLFQVCALFFLYKIHLGINKKLPEGYEELIHENTTTYYVLVSHHNQS